MTRSNILPFPATDAGRPLPSTRPPVEPHVEAARGHNSRAPSTVSTRRPSRVRDRRTISVTLAFYDRVDRRAHDENRSVSGIVESTIVALLDQADAPRAFHEVYRNGRVLVSLPMEMSRRLTDHAMDVDMTCGELLEVILNDSITECERMK